MNTPRLAVIALLSACTCALADPADLVALRTHYANNRAAIEAELSQSHTQLFAAYTNSLNDLRTRLQAAGELEKLMVVLTEIRRVQTAGVLPSLPPDTRELNEIVVGFQRRRDQLELDRAKRVLTLAAKYDKALEGLTRKLTQEGKLDEATAVQGEKTALSQSDPVVAARVTLAAGRAAPPVPEPRVPAVAPPPVRRLAETSGGQPLKDFLPGTRWTWGPNPRDVLAFRDHGKASLVGLWQASWKAVEADGVELTLDWPGFHLDGVTTVVRFNPERTRYDGQEFGGQPISGRKLSD